MDTQERKILYYLLLSALLLATLFFVFFRNLIKHYKRNQWLHAALTTIELDTLEKERQRMKADLHDEFAPLLAATGNTISHISTDDGKNMMLIDKAISNTNVLIDKLRKISFDLVPTTLLNKGLIVAVEELVNSMQLVTTTSLYFSHPDIMHIQPETARHIYRIISEALHNAIKHAAAANCNIHLETSTNRLHLSIVDDGIGFKHCKRGNGLNNIALRTELLKGKFYLDSEPSLGVSILIEIPT